MDITELLTQLLDFFTHGTGKLSGELIYGSYQAYSPDTAGAAHKVELPF